jgi:hypothetical protein
MLLCGIVLRHYACVFGFCITMDGTQKKEEDVYGLLQSTFLVGTLLLHDKYKQTTPKNMQKKEDDKNAIKEAVTIIK